MKIVFAISSLGFGGAERVVSLLANQIVKEHEVKIILTSGNTELAYSLDETIQVEAIDKKFSNLKRWLNFRKLCKEYRADVVFAFMDNVGALSSIALMGTKIPVIISERNDPSQKCRKKSFSLRVLNWISKFLAKGYVFQSEGAKSFYPKIAQKKSCIILNPLNTDNFPQYDYHKAQNRVVSVGRLHGQKNQKLLIDAFAKSKFCKDYTLHIYGEGELREQLQAQINDLGLQGKIVLEGNNSNVLNELVKAKLFVFTSNYEGLPNALMEAMALGLPCISTDCSPGGARMLVDDGKNGLLVPCDDIDSLLETMNKLYDDESLNLKLSEKAKEIIKTTDIQSIAIEWLNFVDKVKKS